MDPVEPGTPLALARAHVDALVRQGDHAAALERCTEYLERFPGDPILRLTRAELNCARVDIAAAERDAAPVGPLRTGEDRARLHRVHALIALHRDDYDTAERHLDAARSLFESAGNDAGVRLVHLEWLLVRVRRGDQAAVDEALALPPPRTVTERRLRALALESVQRYEEAHQVLLEGGVAAFQQHHLEHDVARLRRLIREVSPDGVQVAADPDSPRFVERLRYAQLLVIRCRELLDDKRPAEATVPAEQAGSLLGKLRSQAGTVAEKAAVSLAAGELEMARHDLLSDAAKTAKADAVMHRTFAAKQEAAGAEQFAAEAERKAHTALGRAAHCFHAAAELADSRPTTEVRLRALRLLGRARWRLGAYEEALERWHAAHRIEEEVAYRQVTDAVKVRMLAAASDEHDEWINAEAEEIRKGEPEVAARAASIAVAIEAARGQVFIDTIGGRRVEPPRPGDVAGAFHWVKDETRGLPRSQAVWLMHATPNRLCHVLVCRNERGRYQLDYHSTPQHPSTDFRTRLTAAVEELESYWNRTLLEHSVEEGKFDTALAEVGELLDIGPVLRKLTRNVTRIAVVAHGVLSTVPVAALPDPDTKKQVVDRYAVSDLQTLSARRPLADRARRCRGMRTLLVRPKVPEFARAADVGRKTVLKDDDARVGRLMQAAPGHRIVRVDSHGKVDTDKHGNVIEDGPWLQLARDPANPDKARREGRLHPKDLDETDLRGCGTVMLGACESGVGRRVGRDERAGLVRSALGAGAAAVVGARWIAADKAAADILDRFERYLRYLPRDLALQRAQLDMRAGRTRYTDPASSQKPVLDPAHPASWACWTLYGDVSWQVRVGPVLRWLDPRLSPLRRVLDQLTARLIPRRRHAAEYAAPEGVPVLRGQRPPDGQAPLG